MIKAVFLNNESFELNIDNFFECLYLKGIISHLREQEKRFSQEVYIYIYINPASHIQFNPENINGIKICIIIDEYLKEMPELLASFDFVFQAYITTIIPQHRYFHFPLGYSRQLLDMKSKSVLEREISVFFSGNLHKGRKDFYNTLIGQHWIPFFVLHRIQNILKLRFDFIFKAAYIRFTNGFGKGLSSIEYSKKLFDSKIVLCPRGISNIESFRLYEAMKAGCIVISEPLPDKPFYKDIPIVTIDSWDNLHQTVSGLLLDQSRLEELQRKITSFWNDNLSEKAIASYIINQISPSDE